MQPLQLTLKNFGPYEDSLIDFSDFYAQSLFLITGKTGAGKTTLFDGMTYALYGSTSGGLRQGKEMRSSFASPDKKTSVMFTFKHLNKKYELLREPEQEINKARGTGTKIQPASVCLTIFDSDGKEINQLTKEKDVGPFLSDLLQLNREQFLQIMMLPQGDFRRFLNADSNEKEKVLRKLFNTYIYQEIAENIKDKKKLLSIETEESRQESLVLLRQIAWDQEYLPIVETINDVRGYLDLYEEQTKRHRTIEKSLAAEINELELVYQDVGNRLNQGELINQRFEKLSVITEEKQKLSEQQSVIDSKKEVYQRLKKIGLLEPFYQSAVDKISEADRAFINIKRTAQDMEDLSAIVSLRKADVDRLNDQTAEIEEKQLRLQNIEKWLPLSLEKDSVLLKIAESKKREQSVITSLQQIDVAVNELNQELIENSAFLEKELFVSNQLNQCKQSRREVDNASLKLAALIELKKKKSEVIRQLEQLEREVQSSAEAIQKSRAELRIAKSESAIVQINRLRLDLLPGEPCPVCGALEHPADHAETEISMDSIIALEQRVADCETRLEHQNNQKNDLDNKVYSLKQQTEQLVETIEIQTVELQELVLAIFQIVIDPADWENRLSDERRTFNQKISECTELLEEINERKSRQVKLDEQHALLINRQTEQQQQLNIFKQQIAANRGGLSSLDSRLPQEELSTSDLQSEQIELVQQLNDWQSRVEKAQNKLQDSLEQLKVLEATKAESNRQWSELTKSAQKKQQLYLTKLSAEDLTEVEYLEQRKQLNQIDELEQIIQNYEREMYRIERQKSDLTAELRDKSPSDLTILTKELAEKKELLTAKQHQLTELVVMQKTNQQIIDKVIKLKDAANESLKKLQELTELSDVLNGDGLNKLSLERYVLQMYLEEILRLANVRLSTLSSGRYRFEINQEQGSYKKSTGLEMDIFDDYMGASRSVNTLSGGESFIAALSLSLALTEVIQQNAGGIQIEAMFIDEGFGSLDEDSLEMAIESLETIRGQGRLIGIISHVRELKERIPQQLQVSASPEGKSQVKELLEFE